MPRGAVATCHPEGSGSDPRDLGQQVMPYSCRRSLLAALVGMTRWPSRTSMLLIAFITIAICGASAVAAADPGEAVLAPPDNLVAQGIPPIPASLAEQVGRYAD